jgi:hypothetical protein
MRPENQTTQKPFGGVVTAYLSAKTHPRENGRKHNSKYRREQYGRFPIDYPGNNLEVAQFFYSLKTGPNLS